MDDRLLFAVINGNSDEVIRLLKKEVDVNAKNSHGWTLLHYAAVYNRLDAVQLLLEKGADVMAPTNSGDTPLHFASCNDRAEVACFLLDRGANLFAKRVDGKTALDVAKNSEIVTTLLKHKEKWVTVKELHAETKKDDKTELVPMEVIWYRSIYMKLRDFLDYQQEQQRNDVAALREEMMLQHKALQLQIDAMEQQKKEQKKDIQALHDQLVRQEEASRQQHEALRLENKEQKEDMAELRDALVRQQCAAQQQLKVLRKENKEQKADMVAFRNQRRTYMKALDETNNAIHEKLKAIMEQHEQHQKRRVQQQQLQYRREQLQLQRWRRQQQVLQQGGVSEHCNVVKPVAGKNLQEGNRKALLLQDIAGFELGKQADAELWAMNHLNICDKKEPAFGYEQKDVVASILTQNPVPQDTNDQAIQAPTMDAVTLATTQNDADLGVVSDSLSQSSSNHTHVDSNSLDVMSDSKRRTGLISFHMKKRMVLRNADGSPGRGRDHHPTNCAASSNGTETCTDSSDDSEIQV